MSLDESLARVVRRYDELTALLSAENQDPHQFARLSKEYADLSPVVEQVRELQDLQREATDLDAMIEDSETDAEMKALARDELAELRAREPDLEQRVRLLLLPKDEADEKNAILEIRAGTGGDEAALFAADLFRMYQRYAEGHGWKVNILSASENEIGGYKEIVAEVTGRDVFSRLKFESGVHRVQRVPETESGGRIHTSAATVAVLPEAEDVDIEIRPEDVRIDTMRSSGAGGQHVNTTDSAVRITHLPTGIVVTSSEKSQHQNRARAMQVLRARLFDQKRQEADDARAEARRGQVGSGDRSERIRTYNFPQGRVSDHRINLTLHKLDRIIDGDGLDEIIEALVAEDQAARLAAQS